MLLDIVNNIINYGASVFFEAPTFASNTKWLTRKAKHIKIYVGCTRIVSLLNIRVKSAARKICFYDLLCIRFVLTAENVLISYSQVSESLDWSLYAGTICTYPNGLCLLSFRSLSFQEELFFFYSVLLNLVELSVVREGTIQRTLPSSILLLCCPQ